MLMRESTKIAIASGAALLAGAFLFAGASWAHRGFGGPGMRMGMMAQELLRDVDTDRDGKLTQQEIDNAIGARLTRFDADGNGRLSLEEFQGVWTDFTRPVTVRAFQFLDPNGDAAVAKDELDTRFGRAVQRFDRNGDGALSPEDRPQRDGPSGSWRN